MRAFFRFTAAVALPAILLACAGRITNGGGSGGHLSSGGSGNSTTGNTGGISGGGAGDSGAGTGTGATGTGATGTGATGTGGTGTGATGTGGTGTGGTGTGGGTSAGCPPTSQTCPAELPSAGCPCVPAMGCTYTCPGGMFANQIFATCLPNGRWQLNAECTLTSPCACNPGETCFGSSGSPAFSYSCSPDPCAPAPLSCTCGGKMICGGWPTMCSIPAPDTVLCEGI